MIADDFTEQMTNRKWPPRNPPLFKMTYLLLMLFKWKHNSFQYFDFGACDTSKVSKANTKHDGDVVNLEWLLIEIIITKTTRRKVRINLLLQILNSQVMR